MTTHLPAPLVQEFERERREWKAFMKQRNRELRLLRAVRKQLEAKFIKYQLEDLFEDLKLEEEHASRE